jgi:hypothetical protein
MKMFYSLFLICTSLTLLSSAIASASSVVIKCEENGLGLILPTQSFVATVSMNGQSMLLNYIDANTGTPVQTLGHLLVRVAQDNALSYSGFDIQGVNFHDFTIMLTKNTWEAAPGQKLPDINLSAIGNEKLEDGGLPGYLLMAGNQRSGRDEIKCVKLQ